MLALLFLAAFIFNALHNRYLHRLSKFPGPFLAATTDLYKFFVIASIPTFGQQLHERYGSIVRIGPNTLIFNDPELLPLVYHRKADKTAWYTSWMFGKGVQAMFLTPKYHEHALRKKIVGPACSMKCLKHFEARFDARVDELCGALTKSSEDDCKAVDFAKYLRLFLSDTFNHLAYGRPTHCVRRGEDVEGMIRALQDTYSMAASVALLPKVLVPIVQSAVVQRYILPMTKYGKGMKRHMDYYAHAKREQKYEGFLDHVGNLLTSEEARSEYITFTAATLDGVAAFISPFVDNMLQQPQVFSRVQAEIDDAEAEGRLSHPVATFDEIMALPYFQACINETLRRDAPAQTLLPRLSVPEGFLFGNLYVPGRVEVAASPYIIHRNSSIFGDKPDEFRPERWLEDDSRTAKMHKYGMWFGYSERRCAGENYAQLEYQKLCFELLRRFKIASATPENRFHHEKWAVGMYWNQWIIFEPRVARQT